MSLIKTVESCNRSITIDAALRVDIIDNCCIKIAANNSSWQNRNNGASVSGHAEKIAKIHSLFKQIDSR